MVPLGANFEAKTSPYPNVSLWRDTGSLRKIRGLSHAPAVKPSSAATRAGTSHWRRGRTTGQGALGDSIRSDFFENNLDVVHVLDAVVGILFQATRDHPFEFAGHWVRWSQAGPAPD